MSDQPKDTRSEELKSAHEVLGREALQAARHRLLEAVKSNPKEVTAEAQQLLKETNGFVYQAEVVYDGGILYASLEVTLYENGNKVGYINGIGNTLGRQRETARGTVTLTQPIGFFNGWKVSMRADFTDAATMIEWKGSLLEPVGYCIGTPMPTTRGTFIGWGDVRKF